MDMTQLAMALQTQMLGQNGVAEGQSGRQQDGGTAFADIFMSLMAADPTVQPDVTAQTVSAFMTEAPGEDSAETLYQPIQEDAAPDDNIGEDAAPAAFTQESDDEVIRDDPKLDVSQRGESKPDGGTRYEAKPDMSTRGEVRPDVDMRGHNNAPGEEVPFRTAYRAGTDLRTSIKLANLSNPRDFAQVKASAADVAPLKSESDVPDIGSFSADFGNVIGILAKNLIDGQEEIGQYSDFVTQQDIKEQVKAEQLEAPEKPVLAKPESVEVQPEEVKAQQPEAPEKPVLAKPERVEVQPEEVKAQQPEVPEKPVLAKPERVEVQPEEVKAQQSEVPEKPVLAKPEKVEVQPEEVKAEQPEIPEKPVLAKPEKVEVQPEEVKAQQPEVPEKPVLAKPEKVEVQLESEEVQPEEVKAQQPEVPEKPVLAKPEKVEVQPEREEVQPEEVKAQQPEIPEKPVLAKPEKVEVQPEREEVQPEEVKAQQPEVPEKPVLAKPEKVEVQPEREEVQPEEVKAQQPEVPEKPVLAKPEKVEVQPEREEVQPEDVKAQQPGVPEKPVLAKPEKVEVQPEREEVQPEDVKAQQPEKPVRPVFTVPEHKDDAVGREPESLSEPKKTNVKPIARKQVFAAPQSEKQEFYPVMPVSDAAVYADMTNSSDFFGMPVINAGHNKNMPKISDFSENIITADPVKLSGLLGMVMTGNSIPQNNEILNTLYREMPVETEAVTDTNETQNNAAYDFVNKYIESGEVEILSYKTVQPVKSENGGETRDNSTETGAMPEKTRTVPDKGGRKVMDIDRNVLDFHRTMHIAKKTFTESKKTDAEVKPVDPETLQDSVSRLDIRFDRIDSEIRMNQRFEAPEKQLLKGVQENLKKGSTEFTVKLKPEGLGEIIVKLVKNEGGKMFLSMAASSIKTAELLNRNISTLQNSLSEQNVEIVNPKDMTHTVMPMDQTYSQQQYYGQQHDGYQQNRQFNQSNQQHHGHKVYADTDDAETFDEKAFAPVDKSGLDIMI